MSDLSDEDLAYIWSNVGGHGGFVRPLIDEIRSHRTAQAADEERVRSVVDEVIRRAVYECADDAAADIDWGRLRVTIATRAAKQLASAAARLTDEDFGRIKATRDEMSRFMFLDQIPELIETLDKLLATVRQ